MEIGEVTPEARRLVEDPEIGRVLPGLVSLRLAALGIDAGAEEDELYRGG